MIDKVLIGSAAINYYDPSILNRKSKDNDYLAMERSIISELGSDFINGEGILDKYDFKSDIASLDEIYTLKVSHSPWVITPNSWQKHLKDIKSLKENGAHIVQELHDICYAEWEKRKGKKKVNLNQDKEEFFNGNVRRIYDHDSIHASVAFNDNPMYMRILVDGEEVKTSKQKFFSLTHNEKVQLVREEVMVLSLERDLIPSKRTINDSIIFSSYVSQLKLLITQYSKGYFPQWIIENYYDVLKPSHNYWESFQASDKKILL